MCVGEPPRVVRGGLPEACLSTFPPREASSLATIWLMRTSPAPYSQAIEVLADRPRRERRTVLLLCFLACLTLAHAIYYTYSLYYVEIHTNHPGISQQDYYRQHNTTAVSAEHPLFAGRDHAPNQYRFAVPFAAKLLADRVHLTKYYILFPLFDLICALSACLLLYRLLWRSPFFALLPEASRSLLVALFLVWLAYPFAWAVPWERPETIPTALYLAGMLLLLGGVQQRRILLLALLAATVWQGCVRAEVPVALGAAVALFSFTHPGRRMFGSRTLGLSCGTLILATGIAVQAALKFLVFPHATYPPDTDVFQFLHNLHPRPLATFIVAMLPYACILALAWRYRRQLDPADVLALLISCVYLPLWYATGIFVEVRIFVPFLFVLAPTAAKLILLLQQGGGVLGQQAPHLDVYAVAGRTREALEAAAQATVPVPASDRIGSQRLE